MNESEIIEHRLPIFPLSMSNSLLSVKIIGLCASDMKPKVILYAPVCVSCWEEFPNQIC